MNLTYLLRSVAIAGVLVSGAAHAAITGFTNNPNSNRADWQAAVGSFTTNIDFDGPNSGASYTATSGSLASGFLGDGNGSSGILNTGEGQHPSSNYFRIGSPGGSSQTFTVTFSGLVAAAGLEVIDWFGASGFVNNLTLSAYTGGGGSGSLLGTVNGFNRNYQNNNVYFLGLKSDSANIGSVVFTRVSDNSGDTIGLDNIVSSGTGAVPEPETWAMMLVGLGAVGAVLRGSRRRVATVAA